MTLQKTLLNGLPVLVDSGATTVPVIDINSDSGIDLVPRLSAHIAKGRPTFCVDTVAELQALASPYLIDGQIYRTKRYSSSNVVGDGSGELYIYNASSNLTQNGGFILNGPSGVGRFIALDQSVVNAKKFGAIGNNSVDDTTVLQNAIDLAVSMRIPFYLPSGNYKITDTLWFTGSDSETTGGTSYTVTIYGDGAGYGNSTLRKSRLTSTVTDRPATAIQLGKHVQIQGIAIIGANTAPSSCDETNNTINDWLSAGLNNTRYAHQCGIGVDPSLNTKPTGGYDTISYIGQTTGGSNLINLQDVYLSDHVVGVSVRPDGGLHENNQLYFDEIVIERCVTGVSVAHTNSSNASTISSAVINSCHTAFDCLTYGGQNGSIPSIYGLLVNGVFQLFKTSNNAGTLNVSGLEAKSFNYMGIIGQGSSSLKIANSFVGCLFNRPTSLDNTNQVPYIAAINSPTEFVGCTFVQQNEYAQTFNFFSIRGELAFRSCTFSAPQESNLKIKHIGVNSYASFDNCFKSTGNSSVVPISLNGKSLGAARNNYIDSLRLEPTRCSQVYTYGGINNCEMVVFGDADGIVNDATASSIAFNAGSLTWTTTDAPLYRLGDFIMGSVEDATQTIISNTSLPLFVITDISGNNITATLICDETWLSATPASINIVVPEWIPVVNFTGNTNTSTSITNTSHDGVVEVGDWIKGSADIPNNTRVTAVDDSANTITLSRAATGTTAGVKLYYGQLHTITTTSVF